MPTVPTLAMLRSLKLDTLKEELSKWKTNRRLVVAIVYLSLVLDNMLLTVVVPIIPDYLFHLEHSTNEDVGQYPGVLWPQATYHKPVQSGVHERDQHPDPSGIEPPQESSKILKRHDVSGLRVVRATQQINHARHRSKARGTGNLKTNTGKDPGSILATGERNRREENMAARKVQPRVVTWLSSFRDDQSSNNTVAITKNHNEESDYNSSLASLRQKRVEVYQDNEVKDQARLEATLEEPEDGHRKASASSSKSEPPANSSLHKTPESITNENTRVGLLFSSKAVVQLMINPVVGPLTNRVGYALPLFFGCLILLVAALMFAYAEGFALLFAARSLQGVASSCIAIAGMGVIAELHSDDQERGRVLGFVLGGIALGVLAGYPFGGLLYDFTNSKATPFLALAILIGLLALLQLVLLQPRPPPYEGWTKGTPLHELLQDPYVLVTAGSVMVSASAIAVLEPCLPIWLMDTLHPATWQLGTAFIPDSVGYLLGTNFFADIAYRLGRWRVAMVATVLLAVSATLVPESTSMWALAVPHFGLGLGIGVVDSSLMPLLASLVDSRHVAAYGSVYAIAQTAVAFAYSLGPMVGGAVVRTIGFPWLMRCVAVANLLYCPLLLFLARFSPHPEETQAILLATPDPKSCLTQSTAHVQPYWIHYQHYQQLLEEED